MRSPRILCLLLCQFLAITPAFAGGPRPLAEVHKDLAELEADGLPLPSLRGISGVPPEMMLESSLLLPLLHELHQFVQDESHKSSAAKPSSIPQKAYMVLVDLHRHALRSGNEDTAENSPMAMDVHPLGDIDLIEDLTRFGLTVESKFTKNAVGRAVHGYGGLIVVYLDDDGKIKWAQSHEKPEFMDAVVTLTLEPLLDSVSDAKKIARAADFAKKGRLFFASPSGWKTMGHFVSSKWQSLSLETKKAFIDLMGEFNINDQESADLMIHIDRQKRILPFKIQLVNSIKLFSPKSPSVTAWLEEQLSDSLSPTVRAEAAIAMGHYADLSKQKSLEQAYAHETDPEAKSKKFYALTKIYERIKDSELREAAFVKMAKMYNAADAWFKRRNRMAMELWYNIPPALMLAHGFGKDVECNKLLDTERMPARPEENIWAAEQ